MLSTAEADAICDSSFSSAFAWERKLNGNYVRRWRGMLLTIFKRGDWCSYCINAGPGAVTFSKRAYRTEEQAMIALQNELMGERKEQ